MPVSLVAAGAGAPRQRESSRWRLCRAGIINVYQYDNEVLHFGGGRLLLRGVNGSGKSTAMNMLLPFLLTARQGRIDAAGEQVGILKSWMLSGRDDPQPIGYLWIELEQDGRHLTCGCGIKANRQSDTVSTWWFITGRRPGIDLHLVEGSTPLSADALRAVLGDDPVFPESRRRDYRADVERRLFGGASIDQHIGLINVVRNPRVGDRIDLDLPEHLRSALPQLSDQALAEAAQPLDDLEDHRRNVTELERTQEAIDGLLRVYGDYCAHDLHARVEGARERLHQATSRQREAERARKRADEAAAEVERLATEVDRLERAEARLRTEIEALKESSAYQSALELEGLRALVSELDAAVGAAERRVSEANAGLSTAAGHLAEAERVSRDDLRQVNHGLATVQRDAGACGLTERGPGPVTIDTQAIDETHVTAPVAFDPDAVRDGLRRVPPAIDRRRGDVDEVEVLVTEVADAERALQQAEQSLAVAEAQLTDARQQQDEAARALDATRSHWRAETATWVQRLQAQAAGDDHALEAVVIGDDSTADSDEDDDRASLDAAVGSLVDTLEGRLARADAVLDQRQAEAASAQAELEDLLARAEPEPPRLPWQGPSDHCLADLIDFVPELDDLRRAGLEAALEASGLLSSRLATDGSVRLETGDLVAIVAGGVSSPVSEHLSVTVPDHLLGEVDPGLVAKLLDSISHDPGSGATTIVAADGSFRVGALHGRHAKGTAEQIGATARRAALERARADARQRLADATVAVEGAVAARDGGAATLADARRLRRELPTTTRIHQARLQLGSAATSTARAERTEQDARDRQREADGRLAAATDGLHRVATSLGLPADGGGLARLRRDLQDLEAMVTACSAAIDALVRSVDLWQQRALERGEAHERESRARHDLATAASKHDTERSRLATIEDAIGVEHAEVMQAVATCEEELDQVETDLREGRHDQLEAKGASAAATTEHVKAVAEQVTAERICDTEREMLSTVIALPGVLEALAHRHPGDAAEPAEAPMAAETGSAGLRSLVDQLAARLPARPPEPVTADSVRQSLMRRRDALGAGWDAEARQPDPDRPVTIEVTGPTGKAPLPAAARAVHDRHRQLAGLLNAKQDAALRELLQGLIALEVAEKLHGAGRLVDLMNDRLATVSTAHDIGVRLRWRRSPELDDATARMVDLLAIVPDLRTDDDERELREALAAHLERARREEPEAPYQQLIASALDYRQWHDLTVMLRRGDKVAPLGRRTQLSEGEKKLVTYLPLFAAVAASCDALAARGTAPGDAPVGIPRFLLLDDAFAKVSEDNHAQLFGLLVDLDLDLIATSERLWGTHDTVPELAITEVVRDAGMGVIVLEHYRWDGRTLERLASR